MLTSVPDAGAKPVPFLFSSKVTRPPESWVAVNGVILSNKLIVALAKFTQYPPAGIPVMLGMGSGLIVKAKLPVTSSQPLSLV